MLSDAKHSNPIIYHRHGAAGARGAHNSEDVGSKPTAGIFIKSHRCIKVLAQLYPRVRLRDYKQSGNGLIVNM